MPRHTQPNGKVRNHERHKSNGKCPSIRSCEVIDISTEPVPEGHSYTKADFEKTVYGPALVPGEDVRDGGCSGVIPVALPEPKRIAKA